MLRSLSFLTLTGTAVCLLSGCGGGSSAPAPATATDDAGVVALTDAAIDDANDASGNGPDATHRNDASGAYADGSCMARELPAPTCNSVATSGAFVAVTPASGPPPQPNGGVVTDGTYVLVSSSSYGGGTLLAPPSQTTWTICGDQWDVANTTMPAAYSPYTVHVSFTASIVGSSIGLTQVCSSDQYDNSMTRSFSRMPSDV